MQAVLLRIRIPEPGEIENSGADRADYEKIMWGYVKSVGMDSADWVFEAGGWELDHSDEAWTTPSALHCPSEPDLDACGDAGHEHGPETTEATDIEWAGSDDWAVLGCLAVLGFLPTYKTGPLLRNAKANCPYLSCYRW